MSRIWMYHGLQPSVVLFCFLVTWSHLCRYFGIKCMSVSSFQNSHGNLSKLCQRYYRYSKKIFKKNRGGKNRGASPLRGQMHVDFIIMIQISHGNLPNWRQGFYEYLRKSRGEKNQGRSPLRSQMHVDFIVIIQNSHGNLSNLCQGFYKYSKEEAKTRWISLKESNAYRFNHYYIKFLQKFVKFLSGFYR